MKTTTKIITLALAATFTFTLAALQNQPASVLEGVCEKVGEVKAGNKFNTMTQAVATDSVRKEAAKLGADKVTMKVVSHNHPKLGTQYTAYAIAWKCAK